MGYDLFLHPENLDDFKSSSKVSDRDIRDIKLEILLYCLKNTEDSDRNAIQKLGIHLDYFKYLLEDSVKKEKEKEFEKNKELYFRGWQYSHESDFNEDDLFKGTLEKLLVLKLAVPNADYYDEQEKFYEKWNEINRELDSFEELTYEIMNHKYIEKYGDNKEESY